MRAHELECVHGVGHSAGIHGCDGCCRIIGIPAKAEAWDEGHKHSWRRGPDECQCSAWSWSECGCGKYGTGELLSLNDNPYREETTVRNRLIDVDEETE